MKNAIYFKILEEAELAISFEKHHKTNYTLYNFSLRKHQLIEVKVMFLRITFFAFYVT